MNRYAVRALSESGEVRHLSREAASEDAMALELLREGLTPISIARQDNAWLAALNRPLASGSSPRLDDIAMFCEQTEAMVAAGLTIEQALKVIARQDTRRQTTKMAQRLLPRVQAGLALSGALEAESGVPPYLSGMLRAAEASGRLSEGLGEAGRYLQRQVQTRRALVSALAYPCMVLATVVVALGLVLMVVLPGFEPIFAGEEHRLPRLTRIVLWLSDVATRHAGSALLSVVATVGFVGLVLRQLPGLRRRIEQVTTQLLPVRLATQLDVSRALGVMGMLFRSGVEVSEAVGLAARASASKRVREMLHSASRQLRAGTSISAALATVKSIPDDTRALIEIGEHTGALGAITLRAALLLEAETSYRIERLVGLANPIAIAFLGVIVGLVVGGVMLGILSINQLAIRS